MCPGLPRGVIGDRDKSCASDSAENECGLWESSSYPCHPCVLFIVTLKILVVSFLCTGQWWVRGLSQLLTTVWKTTLGTRQELPQNRGLNNRERLFKTSFSQFSVWWLLRGQWSKPQGNWQRLCRCPGSLDAALAQLELHCHQGRVAVLLHPLLHSLHCLQRRMEGRRGEKLHTLRGTNVALAWKNISLFQTQAIGHFAYTCE